MDDKTKRAPNFTLEDKSILLSLVDHYKHIIENKKTDAITNSSKRETWQVITKKFNASALSVRNAESLRKYYEKLKAHARKDAAEDRKERYLTGGGPAPKKQDKTDDLLISLINKKTVDGMPSLFDGDALMPGPNTSNNEILLEYMSDSEEIIDTISTPQEEDACPINLKPTCKKYKPMDLGRKSFSIENPNRSAQEAIEKLPECTPQSSRRRPNLVRSLSSSLISEQYNLFLKKRMSIADMQQQLLVYQLRQGKIEHDLRVKKLKLEIAALQSELPHSDS